MFVKNYYYSVSCAILEILQLTRQTPMGFTEEQLVEMYQLWLSGVTLRQLGERYNVGHGSIHLWLRKRFGKHCCSPKHQSLARSVLADNPYDPELTKWAFQTATTPHQEHHRHLSKHNQQMQTKYQTLQNLYLEDICLAPEPPEPWLEGGWVFLLTDALVEVLYNHLYQTTETLLCYYYLFYALHKPA